MHNVGYPDGFFDGVYSVEALEHAVLVEGAIREMARVLRPGGKIVIVDKNRAKAGALKTKRWEKWFGQDEVARMLDSQGIDVRCRTISYGDHPANGLFFSWEGQKR